MDASMIEASLSAHPFEAVFWLCLFAAPLGSILIFRRLSFFGDALSHASLSGITFVYLFVGTSPFLISAGALVSVLVTTALFRGLEKWGRLPSDIALTVSYSGMFALGLVLIKSGDLDLEHFLLGDLANVTGDQIWFLRLWSVIALGVILFYWKALWAMAVDIRFAKGLGFRTDRVDFIFLVVTSISVVGVIQSVGVVLVAAYFIFPAVSALPWARSLKSLTLLAYVFALISSFLGIFISEKFALQPGPSIAVMGFVVVVLSHIFGGFRKARLSAL